MGSVQDMGTVCRIAIDMLAWTMSSVENLDTWLAEMDRVFHPPRPVFTKRVARAVDDEWFPDEKRCQELAAEDGETDWRDLDDSEILEFASVLTWMPPDAFRFYYPAWLNYTLRHWGEPHDRVHFETLGFDGNLPGRVTSMAQEELELLSRIFTGLLSFDGIGDYSVEARRDVFRNQFTSISTPPGFPRSRSDL